MLRSAVQIIAASLRLLMSKASSPRARASVRVPGQARGREAHSSRPGFSVCPRISTGSPVRALLVRLACLLVIAGLLRGPFRLRGLPDLIERRRGLL
jgi:hypothetical protein